MSITVPVAPPVPFQTAHKNTHEQEQAHGLPIRDRSSRSHMGQDSVPQQHHEVSKGHRNHSSHGYSECNVRYDAILPAVL